MIEERRPGRLYFTTARARQENPDLDPFNYDQQAKNLDQQPIPEDGTVLRSEEQRQVRKFVGLLALAATPARSKRSLHFDPLANQQARRPPTLLIPHIPPPILPMAQPAPNPRVKAAKF